MVGHASVFQAQKWCYLTLLGAHIELTDVSVALVVWDTPFSCGKIVVHSPYSYYGNNNHKSKSKKEENSIETLIQNKGGKENFQNKGRFANSDKCIK